MESIATESDAPPRSKAGSNSGSGRRAAERLVRPGRAGAREAGSWPPVPEAVATERAPVRARGVEAVGPNLAIPVTSSPVAARWPAPPSAFSDHSHARRPLPAPDLSLIHISEPTRLLS